MVSGRSSKITDANAAHSPHYLRSLGGTLGLARLNHPINGVITARGYQWHQSVKMIVGKTTC